MLGAHEQRRVDEALGSLQLVASGPKLVHPTIQRPQVLDAERLQSRK